MKTKLKAKATKTEGEYLSGTVERITYHNPQNGFTVFKIQVKGFRDLTPVLGSTTCLSSGEYVKCFGNWENNSEYGRQFRAHFIKSTPPSSLEGIEKYLGSGLIKGIGPHFAKKLIENFAESVFEIIENQPEKLSTVEGIGKIRAESITKNWQEQKVVREIMLFLQSHGVGTARAHKIFKTYGEKAIAVVSNNPYQLAHDIKGIGFISADLIAKNLGIAANSVIRAEAGINHILLEAASDGHCALPEAELIQNSQKLLGVEEEIISKALENNLANNSIIKDQINGKDSLFFAPYYYYEKNIAAKLLKLLNKQPGWAAHNPEAAIEKIEAVLQIKLADNQRLAVLRALNSKVLVITGGPGTGKTTIIRSIITLLETLPGNRKLSIKLCAPTGRAAKRLSESTGREATTIHRLLAFDPIKGQFKYNEEKPLECDYLIIDESSMIDVALFNALLKAVPLKSNLLIAGDVDQLPSVGPGQVLADIISSKKIETIRLNKIFRQAGGSAIIYNAHQINQGFIPDLSNKNKNSDFFFIEAESSEETIEKIKLVTKQRIPARFGLDPVKDIQILCAMQRGATGARNLNRELQKLLNPKFGEAIERFGEPLAPGDKVMQIENNYDKEIYNGDIGFIENIDPIEQQATINFEERRVIYDFGDLDQITLAYATTIHKAQGSEYKAVIIPVTMHNFIMLKRNLLYTGITRAKKLAIFIGQKRAIAMAVKSIKSTKRYSKLGEWLENLAA